jgi:curved DNA-binding protein CbpA
MAAANRSDKFDMASETPDYYEILQISPTAEPETVHRVYRLLAQRCHPDNKDTGDEAQFRQLSEAYYVLSDPGRRAQYDISHAALKQARWRLVANGANASNDFEMEQLIRLTVLEVLYTRRRTEPNLTGISMWDLEQLIGRAREQLEFTVWYLTAKRFVTRSDSAELVITVEGAEYLEANYATNAQRRLEAGKKAS